MLIIDPVSMVVLLLMLTVASWTDVRHHRVLNIITLGGAAVSVCLQTWMGGINGLLAGFGGWTVGLLALLPLYFLHGMGAGDVKLMAAVGSFLGPAYALVAVALSLIVGGLLVGGFILFWRGGVMAWLRRWGLMLKTLVLTGTMVYIPPQPGEAAATRFPYALAISAGTVATLAWPHWF